MKYIFICLHIVPSTRCTDQCLFCLLRSGVRLLRLHLESCIDKSLIYLIRILYHIFKCLSSLCYNFYTFLRLFLLLCALDHILGYFVFL